MTEQQPDGTREPIGDELDLISDDLGMLACASFSGKIFNPQLGLFLDPQLGGWYDPSSGRYVEENSHIAVRGNMYGGSDVSQLNTGFLEGEGLWSYAMGALNVGFGAMMVVGGVITAIGSSGVGIGFGVLMALRGIDMMVQGGRQLSGDMSAKSMVQLGAEYAAGGEGTAATLIEFGVDALLDFGVGLAKKAAMKAAKEGLEATAKTAIKNASEDATKRSVGSFVKNAFTKCATKRTATMAAATVAGGAVGYYVSDGSIDGMLMGANFGMTLGAFSAKKLFSCFPAGTPVLTPSGSKPIEEIQIGDMVMSRPEEDDGTAKPKPRRVEECFGREGALIDIEINGKILTTTPEHPFFVHEKGWVEAADLKIGDEISTNEGIWLPLTAPIRNLRQGTAYNFTVEEYHTYFIGTKDRDFWLWVHNTADCVTGNHGKLKKAREASGGASDGMQINHLNQDAAYGRAVTISGNTGTPIAYAEGAAATISGSTFQVGGGHNVFHRVLEGFWDNARRVFNETGLAPTNAQYGEALEKALRLSGHSERQIYKLASGARRQRINFGHLDNMPVPNIPGQFPPPFLPGGSIGG